MGKYLTVGQYKRTNDGVSLDGVTDLTLAMMISRAEAAIDSHMGFDMKRGGFEPHPVMIEQAFDEKTRKVWIPNFPVPVRSIQRYRIQVSNISTAGAGFFADISPSDCVINQDGHYIEIVPLQAITYSLSPVILQLGLKPSIVQLDCMLGFYIPMYGQEFYADGKGNKTFYAVDGFWASNYAQAVHVQPSQLPPVPPIIYVNGVVANPSTYNLDYTEGSVTFNATQMPTAKITGDFTKQIPDAVTESATLQVTHLLARRALNQLGMYNNLYRMRTGEQEIDYPRSINVTEQGRTTASSLCYDAAAVLAKYEEWGAA